MIGSDIASAQATLAAAGFAINVGGPVAVTAESGLDGLVAAQSTGSVPAGTTVTIRPGFVPAPTTTTTTVP